MENEEKIRVLEAKVAELETKLNSLFSVSSFPLQLEDVLVKRGFYNVGDNELITYYESGAGANSFTDVFRIVKYREKTEYHNFTNSGLKSFYVDTTANTCISPNHGFAVGQYIEFRTTDTLPGGLDNTTSTYTILTATADNFTVTLDGVNPVDITSAGTGDQFAFTY